MAFFRSVVCLLLLSGVAFAAPAAAPAAASDPLKSLRPGHPRLLADAATWQRIRDQARTDASLAGLVRSVQADAEALLSEPPSAYHKTGRRLLAISRETLRRVLGLAATYRLTGDARFLQRAEAEMLAVAAFRDWNPSHFLDVGEMTAALAIGYDWLYAELTPAARTAIREAILAKGLKPALDPKSGYNGWQRGTNNWNQVCFGGMVLGSLAIGDEVRDVPALLLARARAQMASGLHAYAPDGVYPEGPGYWSYGTNYTVMTLAALQSALGTDWGYSQSPGFLASAGAFLQLNAPSGKFFDFADSGEGGSFEPALFWFARRLGDAGLVTSQVAKLGAVPARERPRHSEGSRFLVMALVWWPEHREAGAPSLPLRFHGEGPNPIAVFRSSWTDPNALYLALKGGSANLSHAHMDAGSFVFELDGVRWGHDLGMQDYESLESKGIDLWNRRQDGQRWQVFRLNNRSHSTITINDHLHRVEGDVRFLGFSAKPERPFAMLDMTPVFVGDARQARRGFRVLDDRGALVQDEISGLPPGADVCWTMVTAAQAVVAPDGRSVLLRANGKKLEVRVASPGEAKAGVITADPPQDSFNAPNPNRRRVVIHVTAPADGRVTLAVQLSRPGEPLTKVEPLANW